MTELLREIWDEVIVRLWNFGTGWTRFIIRAAVLGVVIFVVIPLLVWPFVLLGISLADWYWGTWFTAMAVPFPLAVLLFFLIGSATLLILAYPLLSGVAAAIPQFRTFLGWFVVVLAIAVFAEIVIGLYVAFVPIWARPWRIAFLVGLAVALGMFLILKRQLGWRQGGWFATMLTLAIIGVTLSFFFAGWREAGERGAAREAEPTPRVEEFALNAGEELDTVATWQGTQHRVSADHEWLLVSAAPKDYPCQRRADGLCEFLMLSGWRSIIGTSVEGPARVKGVVNGTTLRFEKVR